MSIKSMLSLMMVALFSAWLVACGGGSSSSGGGGVKSADNLVVKVNNNGSASFFQTVPGQENRMLAALTDFLISDAMAQTEATVCVYDSSGNQVECKLTVDGVASFFVVPDTYDVCIDPAVPIDGTCQQTQVDENSLTTVTLTCDEIECDFAEENAVVAQPLSDLDQGQDLDQEVTICHVPPGNPAAEHPITISGNALQAHLGHGDYIDSSCDRNQGGGVDIANDDDSENEAG